MAKMPDPVSVSVHIHFDDDTVATLRRLIREEICNHARDNLTNAVDARDRCEPLDLAPSKALVCRHGVRRAGPPTKLAFGNAVHDCVCCSDPYASFAVNAGLCPWCRGRETAKPVDIRSYDEAES